MSNGVNKAILVGNVGKTPAVTLTNKGTRVASFPLATSESWIDKITNVRRDKTEWHNIVVYGEGLVNIVEKHVRKGSKLYVEGSLQARTVELSGGGTCVVSSIVLQGFNCTLSVLDNRKRAPGDTEEEEAEDQEGGTKL